VQKRYHFLRISAFVHATEDEDKVRASIENLLGEPLPDDIKITSTEGFHHNPIIYMVLELIRSKDIRRILTRWEESDFWRKAKEDIEDRLDEDLTYHVRMDKQKACEGELALWKGGGAIDIQLKPATYPASRDGAIKIIIEGPKK
jgi:RNA binding exosome subunit